MSTEAERDSISGGMPTDEVSGVEQTLAGPDLDGPDLDGPGVAGAAASQRDFEHRRAVASARMRLFGQAPELRIGRFPIQSRLGAGGMGEVYLGRDPELGRSVAIKRVLPDRDSSRDEARLRREAQALARLDHPNVVKVYEAGEHQGRLHVVMEYVAGHTLKAWLADDEAASSWRSILGLFLAAGRGLAAAHRAGIVHRDFKPENVLIAKDGQARVADFGLAYAPGKAARAAGSKSSSSFAAVTGPSLAASMVSSVVGTIRFMPLEQLRGETVDARSDQFAFCVALYEALWGGEPYAIKTVHERLDALEAGRLNRPALAGVPRPIWQAIERGLAVAREDRWPDMDALIHALERGLRWRQRIGMAVGAVVFVAGLGVGVGVLADESKRCDSSVITSELDGVWDEGRRVSLRDRIAGVEVAHADASYERIASRLDRWAQGWVDAQVASCEAAQLGAVDPTLAHARASCLTRQQRQVAGFVGLIDSDALDARGLAGALEASAQLPSATNCAAHVVTELAPAPESIADAVEDARTDLAQAHDLRLLARNHEGRVLATAVSEQAAALGYGPLQAEARAELAKAELDDGEIADGVAQLLDAIDLAESHRHDRLAAELWTVAAIRTLGDLEDPTLGHERLRRARASWRRVEPDPRYAAMLRYAEGKHELLDGQDGRAAEQFQAALDLLDQEDAPERCNYESALAWVLERQEPNSDAARAGYERALTCADQVWGPDHPLAAVHAFNLAVALETQGEVERAYALLERAATTWTVGHERPHSSWANAELSLTNLALARGDLDAAERHADALAAIQDEILGPGDPERAYPAMTRASIAAVREQRERALGHVAEAIALLEPVVDANDERLTQMRVEQASNLLALDRLEQAEASYEALVAAGVSPEVRVQAQLGLVEIALRRGRLDQAAATLEVFEAQGYAEHEIGAYALPRAILVALVALRQGRDVEGMVGRARAAWTASPFEPGQLEAWFDDLGLTEGERGVMVPAAG